MRYDELVPTRENRELLVALTRGKLNSSSTNLVKLCTGIMRFIGWKIQTKVRLGGGRWCWILRKHCRFSVCIWVTRLNTGEFHWKVVLLQVKRRVRWKAPRPWCFADDNWNSKSAPRNENADLIAHDFQPADPTWVPWFTHGRNGILCPWKGAMRSYIACHSKSRFKKIWDLCLSHLNDSIYSVQLLLWYLQCILFFS